MLGVERWANHSNAGRKALCTIRAECLGCVHHTGNVRVQVCNYCFVATIVIN